MLVGVCDPVFLVVTDVTLLVVIRACCSTSCFCVRDVSCDRGENHTPPYFLVVAVRFSCESPCAHGQVQQVLRLDKKQLAMLLLNVYPCSKNKLSKEMNMKIDAERPEFVEALQSYSLLQWVEGNPGALVRDDIYV